MKFLNSKTSRRLFIKLIFLQKLFIVNNLLIYYFVYSLLFFWLLKNWLLKNNQKNIVVHFLILFVLIYYIWEGLIHRQVRFLLLYEGFVGGRAELTDRSTWSSSTISHPELCRGPSCFVRLLSAPQSSSEWLWLPQLFSLLHWDVISFLFLAFFFSIFLDL